MAHTAMGGRAYLFSLPARRRRNKRSIPSAAAGATTGPSQTCLEALVSLIDRPGFCVNHGVGGGGWGGVVWGWGGVVGGWASVCPSLGRRRRAVAHPTAPPPMPINSLLRRSTDHRDRLQADVPAPSSRSRATSAPAWRPTPPASLPPRRRFGPSTNGQQRPPILDGAPLMRALSLQWPSNDRPLARVRRACFPGSIGLIGHRSVAWRPGFVEMNLKVRPQLCNARPAEWCVR